MVNSIRDGSHNTDVPRPFLKWIGGKGQLIEKLLENCPSEFKRYHEPFCGGGALFFALLRSGALRNKKVYLTDTNRELVVAYKAIRDDVASVIDCLKRYVYESKYYYKIRSLDPWAMPIPELAARMIYLNRTGFNGLYRVNRKGQYNVPFGRYKNPKICDVDNLSAVSKALSGVSIENESYETVVKRAKTGDFVYFDPPYVPVSSTANFVSYTIDGLRIGDINAIPRSESTFDPICDNPFTMRTA